MSDLQSLSLDDLVVCACGPRSDKARDAIHAAVFRGEIGPTWSEFLRRIKAEERADALELELDQDAIDSDAEAFRYQRDLITAEETEQWLAVRGLNLDHLGDHLARQYWINAVNEAIEPGAIDLLSAPPELRELFIAELILSGQLDLLTTELMWHLAALAAQANESVDTETNAAERQRFLDRTKITEAELSDWLSRLGRDAQWFEETLAMEAAYRRRRETLLEPQARQKELATMRMPLTRFEAEVIQVESRDAAKEALFCIREDGMSMEEVAAEGRYPYNNVSFLRQDVPPDLQQRFLSVAVDDILEPVARGDGFELYRIVKKVEPQPDDPEVQLRIDRRLVERHFSELTGKYIEPRLPSADSAE